MQTLSFIQDILPPVAQINSELTSSPLLQHAVASAAHAQSNNSLNNSQQQTLANNSNNGNVEQSAANINSSALSNANNCENDVTSTRANGNSISNSSSLNNGNGGCGGGGDVSTTSQHYAVIESDHPYKPATVANYKVRSGVLWFA